MVVDQVLNIFLETYYVKLGVWYQNLVLELFSRIKSSSLEIFQLEKLQNIEGMILERNGVDFRNEDDQIS